VDQPSLSFHVVMSLGNLTVRKYIFDFLIVSQAQE
jgi:hypothetical protein